MYILEMALVYIVVVIIISLLMVVTSVTIRVMSSNTGFRTVDRVPMFYQAAKLATLRNVSLSSPPLLVDEIMCNVGDRILVINQTNNEQNGIYVVTPSGLWEPAKDFECPTYGSLIYVSSGHTMAKTTWSVIVVTDGILFKPASDVVFGKGVSRYDGTRILTYGGGWNPEPIWASSTVIEKIVDNKINPPRIQGDYLCRHGDEQNWLSIRVIVSKDGRWVCDPSSLVTKGLNPPMVDSNLHLKNCLGNTVTWTRCAVWDTN